MSGDREKDQEEKGDSDQEVREGKPRRRPKRRRLETKKETKKERKLGPIQGTLRRDEMCLMPGHKRCMCSLVHVAARTIG